ncbi:TonB-dependent receptor plug domain-containing protein, partial [Bacteroidota bacterium]
HNFSVSYLGYGGQEIKDIIVGSAKEVYLNIELTELLVSVSEVVIKAEIDKTKPLNSMALVSARSFSVEETQRFAGGLDDPGRMVSAFAGVVSTGRVEDNGIVIRGNSPKGVMWRLEGVEIPCPSHFAGGNYAGGGAVTLFSGQLLSNSDFFTGAFPAEYGNAAAGVFDVNLRNGNFDKREYTFQAGLLGLDFAAEGPFVKGRNASYLFNYRYSTMSLILTFLPVDQSAGYQDLCFKLNFPTKKAGTFSLWGIGGMDETINPEEPDPQKWHIYEDKWRYEVDVQLGAAGLNHKYIIGEKSFINTTLATSFSRGNEYESQIDNFLHFQELDHLEQSGGKHTFSTAFTHKFNPKLTIKTGAILNYLYYNMDIRRTPNILLDSYQYVKEDGNSNFYQGYAQFKYKITNSLMINGGIYAQLFSLNNNYTVEPRIGLKWNINSKHALSAGYGNHSQLEELKIYFAQKETDTGYRILNKDLDFSKAHHYILEYDWKLSEKLLLKIEPYYQYLYDVPIVEGTFYSFVNYASEPYFNDSLVNKGTGTNIGVDLTLEKYFNNNSYFLITTSIFDSKYVGGDNIERNSRYNRNFVINALGGKEYYVGKNKNNIFGINGKMCIRGGERYIPVDQNLSNQAERVIVDYSKTYEERWPTTIAFDLTMTYRKNKPKYSSIWTLQVLNLFGAKTYYGFDYDYSSNSIVRDELQIILPNLSYKIEF